MPTGSAVVVGVDFSTCGATALRQAVRIGSWSRSAVHAVHVIDTMALIELESAFMTSAPDLHRYMTEEATRSWGRISADVPGAAGAKFHVATDTPARGLARAASEHAAWLLVVGAHGERAHAGAGVVASACARSAPCDVLLAAEGAAGPYKTIVVGIDFSETSRRALERAMRIAAQDGAQVHAVHVYRAPWAGLHLRPAALKDDPTGQARYRDMLREKLEAFCAPTDPEVTWTKPRFEVIDSRGHGHGLASYTRSSGADLVVLGTRGKTNVRDVLLGSTAERVIRESPCSMLVVRPAE
ncbi:MAG: hypothetical protein HBSAPP03_19180 [Phycisphaerae bacterium]|nr:MAG: hypothetical protein HBSAPP03_19180 [Phycisphaerae bacterium]